MSKERLTERDEFGNADIIGVDSADLQSNLNFEEFNRVTEALNKLAEYEDLEEQGLPGLPPVSVGDTLWTNQRMQGWYFRLKDAPYRVKVVFIGLNGSEEMGGGFFNVCYENHDHMMRFDFSDIGKQVFLTQSEAEEKLRELEGK